MQALKDMRAEMERRKQEAASGSKHRPISPTLPPKSAIPQNATIGRVRDKTPVEASQSVRDPEPPVNLAHAKPITRAQAEALLKGGANALAEPIPEGYKAVSKNQPEEAKIAVAMCWARGRISFDFETNADQDEGVDVLEDKIVGMSVSWDPFIAVYLPTGHDSYGANWDIQEMLELFRGLWESEEILKIAFNIN